MFEEVGHHVEKIRRVQYGPLALDVPPGEFRSLTLEEVSRLKAAASGTKVIPLNKPKVFPLSKPKALPVSKPKIFSSARPQRHAPAKKFADRKSVPSKVGTRSKAPHGRTAPTHSRSRSR
jgi:hypothetical protein